MRHTFLNNLLLNCTFGGLPGLVGSVVRKLSKNSFDIWLISQKSWRLNSWWTKYKFYRMYLIYSSNLQKVSKFAAPLKFYITNLPESFNSPESFKKRWLFTTFPFLQLFNFGFSSQLWKNNFVLDLKDFLSPDELTML